MLPLWVRNVALLRRVTEDVAGATFRRTKDPMAVAIFYVALGKDKTLLQLGRLDRPGRLEKLLSRDFRTPEGRAVAEKNAYVLLRRRNFLAAAAVFLLARPAMLREALQVCL
ncbi:unnamed protein product, partial [Phaeothamnion confervicola]